MDYLEYAKNIFTCQTRVATSGVVDELMRGPRGHLLQARSDLTISSKFAGNEVLNSAKAQPPT